MIKVIKSTFYILAWLGMFLATSLLLVIVSLVAILRGRQEQHFAQKPIFDAGEFRK